MEQLDPIEKHFAKVLPFPKSDTRLEIEAKIDAAENSFELLTTDEMLSEVGLW